MKLELKHLAPYLPYELKVSHKDKIYQMAGITNMYGGSFHMAELIKDGNEIGQANLIAINPILSKMNDLSHTELSKIIKHFFKDSRMIHPELNQNENSIRCEKGFVTFYDHSTMQRYTAIKPGGNGLPVLNMSNHFSDYDILFELHVDLFGLIDAGLAIDINNLNQIKND